MEKEDVKVFIERLAYSALAGMEIDYVQTETAEGFALKGTPSQGASCGCSH